MKAKYGYTGSLLFMNLKLTDRRIATMLHVFNLREGFKPSDFAIPERARGNPPLTAGKLKGVTLDFEELKRQYYEAMGYDTETAKVKPDTMEELGLQDIL